MSETTSPACGAAWTTGETGPSAFKHVCTLIRGHAGEHRSQLGAVLPLPGRTYSHDELRGMNFERGRDAYREEHPEEASKLLRGIDAQVDAIRFLIEEEIQPALQRGLSPPFACDGCHGLGFHVVQFPGVLGGMQQRPVRCQACAATGRRDQEGLAWGVSDRFKEGGEDEPIEQTRLCVCGHAESQHGGAPGDRRRCFCALGCTCNRFQWRGPV